MVSMAALPERRVSPAAEWARRLSGFSVLLLVASGLGHRYGLVETVALFWLLGIVFVLAMLGLGLAAAGFQRLWDHGEKAGKASLAATALSLLVLSPYALGGYLVLTRPPLTDISTDLHEPPQFLLTPRTRTGGMNPIVPITDEAAELQMRHYPEVSGRRYEASMDRVLNAVRTVVAAHDWTPLRPLPAELDAREFWFEAEAPTWLLRFPADAALRLTDEGESVFVDLRLNARYGGNDLGYGARRIRAFMAELDAEFTRQSLEIIDIPASAGEEDAVD